jgi:hypothetical protein
VRANWPSRSNGPAVPLTEIQIQVLRLLASHRDPESYVAGATPLNRNGPRFSSDIDVFHDREERVANAARLDAQTLRAAGYEVRFLRQEPAIYSATVAVQGAATHLEWLADSDFRYFPTIPDQTFGYVLHPVDLAMNKVMAAAGRREVRDLVDVVTIHETILPLGAVVWAAVDKSPGFTPEGLIAEIRRNSRYPSAEWRALEAAPPLDPSAVIRRLFDALDDADPFVTRMPTERAGLVFLEGVRVVQPDPGRLDAYQAHAGSRRGHWPTNREISAAMFERASRRDLP